VETLRAWESFCVIVGSSAAALTGLQFVVIALIAESRTPSTSGEIAAFGTPTIVHFCAVLFMSGVLTAPWTALWAAALALSFCGVSGVAYTVLVIRRARRSHRYRPVFEDWVWHAGIPLIAYAALLLASIRLAAPSMVSLFVIAAAALSLLFVGIHNAWDTVTFVAVERIPGAAEERAAGARRPEPSD
jgi:hypothetical protein